MPVLPSTSRHSKLTLKEGDLFPELHHVAEDRRSRNIVPAQAQQSSSLRYAVDLTGATGAEFVYRLKTALAATAVKKTAVIVNAENGQLRYDWSSPDTDVPGEYYGEFIVTFPDGERTFPTETFIEFIVKKDLNT